MEPAVTIAISVFAILVFVAIIAAVVTAASVSSFEQRPEDGEKE